MSIPASSKNSRWFWSGVVAWLLVVAVSLSMIDSPTWANPPDSTPTPQTPAVNIEPCSFRLPRSPEGGTKMVTASSVQPAAAGDWSQLMSTGFEGTFLPLGWEVQGETIWVQSSTQHHGGSYSAGVESFAGAPATWLVYGGESGFSLEDAADARLDFSYWLDTDTDTYFGWAASADGVSFYGARTYGRAGAWLSGSLGLKHLAFDDSVWIAFAISGDGSGTAQNIYLDDVAIRVQEPWRAYLPTAFKNYVPPYPDFHDDFSDPSSGWPRVHVSQLPGYEEHRDYSNEYGTTYRMKLGGWTWFHRIFASPEGVGINDDFTMQTSIMYDLGDDRAEWGLIFEASDDMQNYYMASLWFTEPYVYYRIRRRTPSGGEENLVGGVAPSYLKVSKGLWSTIRVVREGDIISFYAYGHGSWELMASVNAPPMSGERVGYTIFNAELGADGWFDNFHLWQEPLHP